MVTDPTIDPAHYDRAVRAWDDAYADRNGLARFDWDAMAQSNTGPADG